VSTEREGFFRELLDAAPDAILTVNPDGRIVFANARVEVLFGYSRDELIGHPVELLLPERLREKHVGHRADYLTQPRARPMGAGLDLIARRKDGSEFPVEISLSPLPTGDGILVTSIIRDMTERKRMEERLRESEERFRSAFEDTSIGMALQALDGCYLRVNRALCELLGYSEQELLGLTFQAITHPDDLPADLEYTRQILAGTRRSYQVEKRYYHQRGHLVWTLVGVSLVRGPAGLPLYFVVYVQDITERRALEAELRQAHKMEAVGRLAGGIAHDFNNLLAVIQGRSELLLYRLGADDPLRRHTELIKETAVRASRLTRQLLAFSRKELLQPKVLDLSAVVAGLEPMLRRLIREDIALVTVADPARGCVRADPGQLEQVILNLVVNARDAMPEGGRLTIETATVELDERFVRDHPGSRPGVYARLVVADTGVGMDAETQRHLFEPFFTTKGPGQGTGLGLTTVYAIVKQHAGYVTVESAPGRGARFVIYLPRVEEPAEELPPAEPLATWPRGSETILVVENHEGVRQLVCEILQGCGYNVIDARHPGEALLIGERRAGLIHLLLTDVVMPEMGGRELAERLVGVRPGLKVLYLSGHAPDALGPSGVLEPDASILPKPFAPDALAQKVREVLASR
jgi:PAS domain S-box-containing protein